MIKFTLKCSDGHAFESWFQSASAYDSLKKAGMVECAICGTTSVDKAIMAPRVTAARKKASPPSAEAPQPAAAPTMGMGADADMRKALEEMKRHVEENSDYVGDKFAQEARAMHLGDAPERAIYGETRPEEAKSLIEDGVPVAPLPFIPTRKSN